MSLAIRNDQIQSFSLTPRNLDEAMKYAELISNSDFCPKDHKGKPGNVLIAIQYGAELGLSPMQCLQNISIINGRPCVWGDALLGLVMSKSCFVSIDENVKNGVATCTVRRKNKEPVTTTFSIDDAKRAGLWGKVGPWTNYPNRMLQMRARSFALRDLFPDVLKGLNSREEVEDYHNEPTKPKILSVIKEVQEFSNDMDEVDFKADIEKIHQCNNLKDLEDAYHSAYKLWVERRDKARLKKIIELTNKKKKELEEVKTFTDEMNGEEKQ